MQAKQTGHTLDRKQAQHYLNAYQFQPFFTELMGWNATPATRTVKTVDRQDFHFTTVAEKRGYTVLLCDSIPAYPVRAKLDRLVSRDHFEHIIVFVDRETKRQVWQVSLREKGHPVKLREVLNTGHVREELIQKLEALVVPLALEDTTHLSDLLLARRSFDRDKVTKSFFKQFEAEHKSFLKFLKGVPKTTEAWYVSVLINRLMFLYFIQSKSFLDGNPTYLTDKLQASTARKKDTFYRDFLCPLFFEGFALKKESRTAAVKALLGDIPYLNGGLFQKHGIELQAEEAGIPIVIPDAAFQKLFAFFNKWTWHLDPDENATGDEIDPDVLGYIFEKYINQKQMGAYYTKEDITGYIAQNTVLPFLFDTARKGCANAFQPDGAIWRMLRDDPDVYIYPAMRRGNAQPTRLELPPDIAAGLDNVSLRTGWNRPIPADFADAALPTETWREFIARRRRYDDLRTRIAAGEVHQVNDLITLNLDIRQLALDSIQIAGSEDLVESLYKAIESVTILDPTCGSGAFLFAALELLQPLYQACLLRMQQFIEEAEAEATRKGKPLHFNRFKHFRDTLEAARKHVNIDYFILKTIIVQNLYGVDIMEEATEICKLRLFLKLVAQIDSKQKDKIEPLPDIDFNIRAGNTLVGFARYDDVKKAAGGNLFDAEEAMSRIDDRLQTIDAAAAQFRRQQTELGGSVSIQDKQDLTTLYKDLEAELDEFLSSEYGIKRSMIPKWKTDNKPFHWFCDFHAIIDKGGFDVIVGNPPYVEVPKHYDRVQLKKAYATALDKWSRDEDLYTFVFERSLRLISSTGTLALILPLSLAASTKKSFQALRKVLASEPGEWWWAHFDRIPDALFGSDVRTRCTIALLNRINVTTTPRRATTGLTRWTVTKRPTLFQNITYSQLDGDFVAGIPKVGSQLQADALAILQKLGRPLAYQKADEVSATYLQEVAPKFPTKGVFIGGSAYNWFPAWRDIPKTTNMAGEASVPARTVGFLYKNDATADVVFALLCSSLGYWWWAVASDGFNLKKWLVERFPLSPSLFDETVAAELAVLGAVLRKALRQHYVYKDNQGRIGNYYLPACHSEIQAIDQLLAAQHHILSPAVMQDIQDFNQVFGRNEDLQAPGDDN